MRINSATACKTTAYNASDPGLYLSFTNKIIENTGPIKTETIIGSHNSSKIAPIKALL
jgi:hypothetical protein